METRQQHLEFLLLNRKLVKNHTPLNTQFTTTTKKIEKQSKYFFSYQEVKPHRCEATQSSHQRHSLVSP